MQDLHTPFNQVGNIRESCQSSSHGLSGETSLVGSGICSIPFGWGGQRRENDVMASSVHIEVIIMVYCLRYTWTRLVPIPLRLTDIKLRLYPVSKFYRWELALVCTNQFTFHFLMNTMKCSWKLKKLLSLPLSWDYFVTYTVPKREWMLFSFV